MSTRKDRMMALIGVSLWTIIVGVLAYKAIPGMIRQYNTHAWLAVQGTVVSSKTIQRTDSEGDSYLMVDIKYRYAVANAEYASSRLRFYHDRFSQEWTKRFVNQHSSGSAIKVYYDPTQPGEAILIQGLQGFDLLIAMFMTPFVLLAIGLWGAVIQQLRHRKKNRTIKRPLYRWGIVWFGGTLCLSSVLLMLSAFFLGGYDISLKAAQVLWIINFSIAGAMGGFYVVRTARQRAHAAGVGNV